MNKKWIISLIGVFLILVVVLVFVGMNAQSTYTSTYIMVEYIHASHVESIKGGGGIINATPGRAYRFDKRNKTLKISDYPPDKKSRLNKNVPFKLVLGFKHRAKGDIELASEQGEIVFINGFPYEFPKTSEMHFGDSKPLDIIGVDNNGIVSLKFNDKDIKIKPNSEIEIPGESKVTEVVGIQVRMMDTYIFKNHGFCSKKDITINE